MNRTIILFASILLLPVLDLPLCAQTALEQVQVTVPGTELSIPLPAAGTAAPVYLSPEEARKKLRLFAYQKTDVLSVKRNTPDDRK